MPEDKDFYSFEEAEKILGENKEAEKAFDIDPITGDSFTDLNRKIIEKDPIKINAGPEFNKQLFQTNVDYMSNEQWESYQGYDINFSPYLDWDQQRAENQGTLSQIRGFLNQAIVGEVIGGSIEGLGILADWVFSSDATHPDFFNEEKSWFTTWGEGLKEWAQEATPIYAENPGKFDPWDFAWWAQGGVSVASFASMLIPARAAGGLVSILGKGAKALGGMAVAKAAPGLLAKSTKLASRLNAVAQANPKAAKLALGLASQIEKAPSAFAAAYVSRNIESILEGGQVYKELHQKYLDQGFSVDEANKLAGLGAAHVVKENKKLLNFDFFQFMLMANLKGMSPGLKGFAEKAGIDLATKQSLGRKVGSFLLGAASEAGEEGYQFIAGEEGKFLADKAAGLLSAAQSQSSYGERFNKYLKDQELYTSMFFGAFGGAIHQGISPILDKATESSMYKAAKLMTAGYSYADAQAKVAEALKQREVIQEAKEKFTAEGVRDTKVFQSLGEASKRSMSGTFEDYIAPYEAVISENPETLAEHNEKYGDIPIDDIDALKDIVKYNRKLNEAYKANLTKYENPVVAASVAQSEVILEKYQEIADRNETQAETLENNLPTVARLSPAGRGIFDAKMDLLQAKENIKKLKALKKDSFFGDTKEVINDWIESYKAEIPTLEQKIKDAEAVERTSSERRKDKAGLRAIKTTKQVRGHRSGAMVATLAQDVYQERINAFEDFNKQVQTGEAFTKNEINNLSEVSLVNAYEETLKANNALTPELQTALDAKRKELQIQENAAEERKKASTDIEDLTSKKNQVEMGMINATSTTTDKSVGGEQLSLDFPEDTDIVETKDNIDIDTVETIEAAVVSNENALHRGVSNESSETKLTPEDTLDTPQGKDGVFTDPNSTTEGTLSDEIGITSQADITVPKLMTVRVDLETLSIDELKNVRKQLRQKAVDARERAKGAKGKPNENVYNDRAKIVESDYQDVKKYIAALEKPTQQGDNVAELFESNPELANEVYDALDIDVDQLSYSERVEQYKKLGIKKSDGSPITEEDIKQNPDYYQKNNNQSDEEYIASEKTIRDLAERLADRIGLEVKYESDRTKKYKGKLEGNTAVINLAYATLDTPIHEILGHPIIRAIKNRSLNQEDSSFNKLYENLLEELSTTQRGKEVLDRIKRDYVDKPFTELDGLDWAELGDTQDEANFRARELEEEYYKNPDKYTLEEQQEEAIVELLGLYTADRLDKVKDGKLISLLKRLLKEMKAYMRSLFNQKEVNIDKLSDDMTLGDIADLLAYSNSKLILPGNEVFYTTPDNETFKTYQEASNHISKLAKLDEVDLSDVSLEDEKVPKINSLSEIKADEFDITFPESHENRKYIKKNNNWYKVSTIFYDPEFPGDVEYFESKEEKISDERIIEEYNFKLKQDFTGNPYYEQTLLELLEQFISRNKEFEQSKEIIEEWKRVNDIQYDPEEVYSRGQGFYSVVGAYSDFDVELMFQNLLTHIEDNKKAGGEFTISAFTKPVDKQIGHLEGGGGKIKFKIFPKSEDIKWASNTDVYSGSVWDASEKVNKDKKSEIIGVSYTKSPAIENINSVQPNLASIIDNLAHHHNELGIELTGDNFRLEYDDNVPYSTKKLLDNINKILDQKFGKLVEPEISKGQKSTKFSVFEFDADGKKIELNNFNTEKEAKNFVELQSEEHGLPPNFWEISKKESFDSKQPTQTKENLNKNISEVQNSLPQKEYISQSEINTKVAALKEGQRKFPRSLIRSEVVPYKITVQENAGILEDLFIEDDLPFQLIQGKELTPKQRLQNELTKQKAQQKFQEYINTTGRQDIQGFKEFVGKSPQQNLITTQPSTPSKDYPVDQPKTSKKDFKVKSNLISAAWLSINNGGEPTARVKELSDLAENPDRTMEGMTVVFSFDDNINSLDNPEYRDFAESGRVTDNLIDTIAIKATLLDSDGKVYSPNDVDVYMHLHNTMFGGDKVSPAERQRLRNYREEIIDGIATGATVSASIDRVGRGNLLQEENENRDVHNSIRDIVGTKEVKLLINNGNTLLRGSGQEANDDYPGFASKDDGLVYLDTTDNNGVPFPLRLNARTLNQKEADFIINLYKDLLDGAKPWDVIPNNSEVDNLRYVDAFNLLVAEGPITKGRKNVLYYDKNSNNVVYGTQENTKVLSKDLLGTEAEADFKSWLLNNAVRYTNLSKINKPITEFREGGKTVSREFSLFGKSYTKEDKYNDFLVDDLAISTNAYTENGKLFVQPTIHFSPEVKLDYGIPDTPTETMSETPISTNETSEGTDTRSLDDIFGGAIKPKFSVKDFSNVDFAFANMEQEVLWLESVIPNIPREVRNRLIRINAKGDLAQGAYKNGMITLAHGMVRGTAYHEAFHAVFDLYLTDKEKTTILKEARDSYGIPSEEELKEYKVETAEEYYEERLAEDFKVFITSDGKVKFSPAKKSFFRQLVDLIRNIFISPTSVNAIYDKVRKGYYKNMPVSPRIEAMSDKAMYSRVPGWGAEMTEAMTESLVAAIAYETDVFASEDLSAITQKHVSQAFLKKILGGYAQEALAAGNQGLVNTYIQGADHIDVLQERVLIKFKDLQLNLTETPEALYDSEIDLEDKTNPLNIKPAFEFSGKDNATGNVRLLLSTLPKMKSTKLKDYKINKYTGRPELASLSSTWGILSKNLADINTTVDVETGTPTWAWDKMLEKISELTLIRPELSLLYNKLSSKAYPEVKKAQFFNAFSKTEEKFKTPVVADLTDERTGTKIGVQFKIKDSETNSPTKVIQQEWQDALVRKLFEEQEGELVPKENVAERVQDRFTKLFNITLAKVRAKEVVTSEKAAFRKMLDNVGFTLTDAAFDYFTTHKKNKQRVGNEGQQLIASMRDIQKAFTFGLNDVIDGKQKLDEWVFEQTLTDLAKVQALFREDISETTVPGAENERYYKYSLNSYLKKQETELKENPKLAKKYRKSPGLTNSEFLRLFETDASFREGFEIVRFNNFRKEGIGDTGNKAPDLSPADEFGLRIDLALSGYLSTLTPADKSTWDMMKIPKEYLLKTEVEYTAAGYQFNNPSVVHLFGKYFVDELARMRQAWQEVYGTDKLDESQFIQYYHKDKNGGPGNAFKSQLFPSLSPRGLDEDGNIIGEMSDTAKAMGIYMSSENFKPSYNTRILQIIKDDVQKALSEVIERDLATAEKLGLIEYSAATGGYINNSLDTKKVSEYMTEGRDVDGAIRAMMADFSLNALRGNVETTKLFTGDPAFYKNATDLQKRVPGIIAPGQDLFIYDPKKLTYNIAVLNDLYMSIDEDLFNQYKDEVAKVYPNATEAEIEEMLKDYKEINVADAQAYITLERYRDLLKGLGKWKESTMAPVFDALIAGEKPTADQMVFLQPLKGMYFALRSEGNKRVPTYLKYSQAPLIPGLIRGTKLDTLREKMRESKVDEVVFNSGIKAGARGQADIGLLKDPQSIALDAQLQAMDELGIDEGTAQLYSTGAVEESGLTPEQIDAIEYRTRELSQDAFTLTPITLDNRHWKLQQDLPSKYMKKEQVIEPSQLIKNVLANINPKGVYGVNKDGSPKTGKQVIEEFIQIDKDLSDLGAEAFREEFGVEVSAVGQIVETPGLDGAATTKLYTTLIEELQGRNAPDDVIEALKKGTSLDAIPQYRKKIQQTILSMLNKRTVKTNMPGGAFIQMSVALLDYMFPNGSINSDIVWASEDTTLKPPRLDENGNVLPGQILLPSSAFEVYRKALPGLSDQEILQNLKEEGLLEGVGARIPNQDMGSSDYLEVVGVLPAYMGDTVVTYKEITVKTGSDFDIDKMYIMLPNYYRSYDYTKLKAAFASERNYVNPIVAKLQKEDIGYAEATPFDVVKNILEIAREDGVDALSPDELIVYEDFNEFSLANKASYFTGIKKVSSESERRQGKQNRKLELYKDILTSKETFGRLISPIDASWLEKQAEKIAELKKSNKQFGDLSFFGATQQFETKLKFTGGKFGVGQTANQLVDHPLTQMAEVQLSTYLGVGPKHKNAERSLFFLERDENGGLITSNLSAYLNAFVDIAKGPYIYDLNINTYTSNTAFMLIRAGVSPEWVNAFMAQPILVDLANEAANSEGRLAKPKYFKEGRKKGKRKSPVDLVKEKYKSEESAVPFVIDMPSSETLYANIKEVSNDFQLEVLKTFEEFKSIGEDFARQVSAFKFDTNGAGTTLIDSVVSLNKMNEALSNPKFINVANRLEDTMVETYARNSAALSADLFKNYFIGASDGVLGNLNVADSVKKEGSLQSIGALLGKADVTSKALATVIENDAFTYILEKFEGFHVDNPKALFEGDNAVGPRVFKQKYNVAERIQEVTDNLLIQQLSVEEEEGYSFVRLKSNIDTSAKNALTRAWEELIYNKNPEIAQLGKDLIHYSFYSSGLRAGRGSFSELIPEKYLEQKGLDRFIQEQMEPLNHDGSGSYLTRFNKQFFSNNINNPQVVPAVSDVSEVTPVGNILDAFSVTEYQTKYVVKNAEGLASDYAGFPVFYPFLNLNGELYRLQGYKDIVPESGKEFSKAYYVRAQKFGFTGKRNKIFEFGEDVTFSQYNLGGAPKLPNDIAPRPYSPIAPPRIQKQKFSTIGNETTEGLEAKLDILQKSLEVDIKYDETIPEIATVQQEGDRPVMTLNRNKLQKDTVIHEYGHIYISSLGGLENEFIAAGVEQLRDTPLWRQVAALYPELHGDALAEEVLATAIGMEGQRIFDQMESQTRWQKWITTFFEKLAQLIGIKPNVAKQLAKELLTNQLRERANAFMDSRIRQQKDPNEVQFLDAEEELSNIIERIKTAVATKIKQRERLLQNRTADAETTQKRKDNLEKLQALQDQLAESEGIRGVVAFVNRAKRDSVNSLATLKISVAKRENLTSDRLQNIQSYLATYDILDDLVNVVNRLEVTRGKDYSQIKDYILNVITERNKVQQLFDTVYLDVLASELAPHTHLVETKHRLKLEADFNATHKRSNYASKQQFQEAKDIWINEKISEKKEEIEAEEWSQLRKRLEFSKDDISMLASIGMDPRGINDQLMTIGSQMIERADFATKEEFIEEYKTAYDKYEKFVESRTGKFSTNMETLNGKFLIVNKRYNSAFWEYVQKNDLSPKYAKANLTPEQEALYTEEYYGLKTPMDAKLENFTPEETEYLEFIKDLFDKADELLPDNYKLSKENKLPGIRKTTKEQLTEKGVKAYIKEKWKSITKKDADDVEEGETQVIDTVREVMANEKGEEAKFVPIHFRNSISLDEQSKDLFAMAMSNYYMALNFQNKIKIAPRLQLLQEAVNNQKVAETTGGGLLKVFKFSKIKENILKSDQSNLARAFNSMVDSRLYGINMKDAGEFMGMNVNKLGKSLMKLSGDLALVFNYPSAIVNTIQGHIATMIEARGGRFFGMQNVKNAQAIYGKEFRMIMSDVGREGNRYHSKMNLMLEKFDMLGQFDGLINSLMDDRRLKRLLKKSVIGHGFNNMAEHYIQSVLMTAIFDNIKVIGKDGKYLTKDGTTTEIKDAMTLWDAYTVNEDYRLEIDPRVATTTRARGKTEFTSNEEFEISQLAIYLNADLNGNYATKNKSVLQRSIYGRMVEMLRKWIARGVQTRFRGISQAKGKFMSERDNDDFLSSGYVEALRDVQEGRYTTGYNFIRNMFRGFAQHKFNVVSNAKENYSKLGDIERANMRKNGAGFATVLVMYAVATAMANIAEGDKEEDDKEWAWFIAYIAKRAQLELQFYLNPSEMVRTLDSPSVVLKTLSDLSDAIAYTLFSPTETWRSGVNKDKLKFVTAWEKLLALSKTKKQFSRDFERSFNFIDKGGFK